MILVEREEDRTTTFVVQLERPPDAGSVVEFLPGQRIVVRHVLGADEEGMAGVVIAAPPQSQLMAGNLVPNLVPDWQNLSRPGMT